ncbi:SufD family Fe-S cluster assembly protein [Alkalicaulis satelles]|uniref:SufD family Fe-S cluster assembly protein n=1 Tax=Alkalicaulis satelles TaxID=2609175 RepID=A0A5M6ZJD5_9PROT|nr:SufD family Fe-S cluster assembly protein [Alkalicaulis satelles]KAA5804450.1 SufD family Fe-S cluster assembly protein [Alkalicaulis satelles]
MNALVKLSAFEAALAEALPEGDLRAELSARGLPHRRVEDWKWSDLRTALARFDPASPALTLTASRSPDRTAEPEHGERLMARLAGALGQGEVYELAPGERLSLDIRAEAGAGHKVIEVIVPDGAEAALHETYQAAPGALANIALVIRVGAGARLTRLIEQDASPDGVIVLTGELELAQGARAHQTTLGFGARLARLETRVRHAGGGAHLTLDGACHVGAGLHLDQTTIVRHEGPDGITRELFKSAAAPGGRAVFQGKIHVERPAQKTDAQMNHRALLLGEGAEIDAKPELEIYADDVVCAHGNALGALDAAALFYMRQRGLDDARARALLTESFLMEPLDAVADEAERERLKARLRASLGAVS